jgi:exonuclease III
MTSTIQSTTVQARARDDTKSSQDPAGSHDGTTPNSSERVVPDGNDQVSTTNPKTQKQLLKCTKPIIISSLNTRTLNPVGRVEELSHLAMTHNIDVVCIQDHKFYHPDDDLQYHKKIQGQQLITASCWKNSINASVGGVGFLLSTKAQECLSNIEKINSRITVVEFDSNPKTTIVSCYSPTNCSPEEEVDEFYSNLKSVCDNTPPHNLLLLCGDFNAKLGNSDAQFTIHTETNRNGEKLADLLTEHNLCATNTRFMNKPNKLWTFRYPNGNKAQLDYILVRRKWINSVKNSRAYSSFDSVLSDHRIVSAKIKRPQKKKPGNPMSQIDWPLVINDSDLTNNYTVEVHNRFSELCPVEATPHEKYQLLSECVQEVALASLPKKKKRKAKSLSTEEAITKAREELLEANNQHSQNPTKTTEAKVKSVRMKLQTAYDTATAEELQEQINHLSSLHTTQQHSAAWKAVNEITGRKDKPTVTVQGGSAEKRNEGWLNHFKKLLGEAPKVTPDLKRIQIARNLNISTANFTHKELSKAIDSTSKKKKMGLDNIPPIIWKDPKFHDLLLENCNFVLNSFDAPELWLRSGIVPLPKKGNLTLHKNYRGISLTCIAAKIYNKLLLNRIFPALNPILRRNQNGFRKGRSTIAQILALRRIIEEMNNGNKELTIVFVDFKKAFDSIHREVMFEILGLYGIPEKIINAIKALYTNTKAKVITPDDGETELFDIVAGVLQGDTRPITVYHRLGLCAENISGHEQNQRSTFQTQNQQKTPRRIHHRPRLRRRPRHPIQHSRRRRNTPTLP